MRHDRWEYKTLHFDVSTWLGPKLVPEQLDAELNAHGEAGWDLVSTFDVNGTNGTTKAIVAVFKRPRA